MPSQTNETYLIYRYLMAIITRIVENPMLSIPSSYLSPDTGAQEEICGALEANARLQERLEPIALPAQAVHDVRTGLDMRRLEHEGQEGEHRVERVELSRAVGVERAVLDACEEFGEDGEVEDERGR